MELVKKMAPSEFAEIDRDPQLKAQMMDEVTNIAQELNQLSKKFSSVESFNQSIIEKTLREHLSTDRIDSIKKGLQIPTIRMNIVRRNGIDYAETLITGGSGRGGELYPPQPLRSKIDIDRMITLQNASILMEIVMLMMSIVKINFAIAKTDMSKMMKIAVDGINRYAGELPNAFVTFIQEWKKSENKVCPKSLAIFQLILKCCFSSYAVIGDIAKGITEGMSRREKVFAFVRLCAVFVSSGTAVVPMISLALMDASDFVVKIKNVVQLGDKKIP